MTIPTHLAVDLAIFLLLMQIHSVDAGYADLALILGSNLIDMDHFYSDPIYHPRRNPFTTHRVHRAWLLVIFFSVISILIRPLMFLGIGLLAHLSLDYLYIRREKL